MLEFRVKISPNGRLVIPAQCRRALGISFAKTDELIIKVSDEEAKLFTFNHAVKKAQEEVKKKLKGKINLTEELLKMRRREAKND